MAKMKTLTIGGTKFEIVDQTARDKVDNTVGFLSDLNTEDQSSLVAAINEILAKGVGSGSGTTNNAVLTVTNTTGWLTKTITLGAACSVSLNWSSLEGELTTGDGVVTVTVNGSRKLRKSIKQGDVPLDIAEYLTSGDNTVRVKIEDVYGNSTTIRFSISVLTLTVTSTFDAGIAYSDAIAFTYTPIGNVAKNMEFWLDGVQIGTASMTTSGRQASFTIPAQSHGVHAFEVFFKATVDGEPVESNHLYYDLICITADGTDPVIASAYQGGTVEQYDTISIPYRVYDPDDLTSVITLEDHTGVLSTLTVDRTEQTWSYFVQESGSIELTIRCGDIVKTITLNATASTVPVEAETEGLALYLTSRGRSNNEELPGVWGYGDINVQFEGFNFKSDGWQLDEDGVTVLRVAADARLTIPYQPFASDFRTTGKTLELEFASRDVLNYDAVLMSCMSGGRGFEVTAQRAILASEQSSIGTQYKEEEHVRLSFVVEKKANNRFLLCYINGILSGSVQYPDSDDFSQTSPVYITIGSSECTTDIYNIRVYDNDLTRYQILDNWIADTQVGLLRKDRYERNNIYDAYGQVTIETLKADLPYLVISASVLPQSKGDKKLCSGYYVDPVNPEKNFEFEDAVIDVQGTSSQYYYVKNYKIKFSGGFLLANGTESETYQLNSNVVPTNTYTFKADVASSEGANNVVLAQIYNDLCPVKTPPQEENSKVRQTIDGHPIVIFWDSGSGPQFIGKYNFNHDKGTEEVFGFSSGDESWEILQNGTDRVGWKSADFSGTDWKNDFEARYPEDNVDTTNLAAFAAWLVSTNVAAATGETLDAAVTYDDVEYTTDSAEYRKAKFRAELPDHANVDALVFYYVITEIFLCIDQREKNAFPTRWADDPLWMMLFYDADSSLGIDNKGNLAFDYFLEDIDYTEAGDPIYNGQNSVLWVNLRDMYYDEILAEYQRLRTEIRSDGSGNPLLSYDVVNNLFEAHQSKWSEAVYNEDGYRKCLEPMIVAGDSLYLPMLQGKKEQQRKWWLYNRFRYLDSKYNTGTSMTNRITIRAHAKANINLIAYVNMYGHVYYNAEMVEHRMVRGEEYEFEWAASGAEDPVIGINDADMLTSLGDLSPLMVELIDISKATHLTALKVGDSSSSYVNNNLNSITLGNNVLLKTLDLRNCASLTQAVDVSGCTGLEEAYFDGTSVTGVTLPNGGVVKKLHLPGTVTNLTLLNQTALSEFVLPSYSNISTLRLEHNGSIIDPLAILDAMAANGRVRIIGFTKHASAFSEITDLIAKLDTMRGLDEGGNNTDYAQVSGTVYIEELTQPQLDIIREAQKRYPSLSVAFSRIKTYTVGFYVDGVLMQTVTDVTYGSTVEYDGIPTRENASAAEDWRFIGWSPEPINVTGDMVCVAQFKNVASAARALVTREVTHLDLSTVTTIGSNAFTECGALSTLILRSDTVCTLTATNAFNSTPIASGTGYIYVPSALVDEYKAATNWSTYADQFRAIEDYPDICG